ncbi:MAG TPA: hypothetical protein PKK00_09130 [Bacteroidales bacterium]|nr:hypothetical protein [Bacteroidales bacterium]HPS17084.1 hypothetical protein [Bacteroidales bacterium]
MKKRRIVLLKPLSFVIFFIFFSSCLKDETPTKTKMEGVWEVTAVYNEQGTNITSKVEFPVVAFYLVSDNSVSSTAGPLFMYIVYGDNKYTTIASQIDQTFNYLSLDFNNGGEFFIGGGQQERFTIEMKLEGLPGQKALTTLLDLLGITQDYLDLVIYHKFMDVKVDFDATGDMMYWEFDSQTTAVYNTKDNYGNYVLWQGWPVNNFSKCRIELKKRSVTLKDVVKEHS